MNMDRRKCLSIGRRTHKNVLEGKHIRKDKFGNDLFEDYWTDNEESSDSSTESSTSSAVSQVQLNTKTNLSPTASQVQMNTTTNSVHKKKAAEPELSNLDKSELEDTLHMANPNASLLQISVNENPSSWKKNRSQNLKKSSMAEKSKCFQIIEEILPSYDEVDRQLMEMGQKTSKKFPQACAKNIAQTGLSNSNKSIKRVDTEISGNSILKDLHFNAASSSSKHIENCDKTSEDINYTSTKKRQIVEKKDANDRLHPIQKEKSPKRLKKVSKDSENIHGSNRTLDIVNSFSHTSAKKSKTIKKKKDANDVETSKNYILEEDDSHYNATSNSSNHIENTNKACGGIDNYVSHTSTKKRKIVKEKIDANEAETSKNSVSVEKDFHNNDASDSSKQTENTNKACDDINSFNRTSTEKRKIVEKKDANGQLLSIQKQKSPKRLKRVSDVSGSIHKSNRTFDIDSSFSHTSTKKSKAINEKRDANEVETSKTYILEKEDSCYNATSYSSNHIENTNEACDGIDNYVSHASTKKRKVVKEKIDTNEAETSINFVSEKDFHNNDASKSSKHTEHANKACKDIDNSSHTFTKKRKIVKKKIGANEAETSKNSVSEEEDFQINDASNTSKHANKACENIDNSISRTSTKERKRVKEKKDVNHRPQSIQKQKSPKRLKRVSDVSGNIHRSNRTLDFYNSFSRTSSKESKTITEKKTANDVETSKNSVSEEEVFQINDASNTSKHANKACENIDNSISRTSTKERKRVKEKKDVNHRPQSIQKQKSPKRLKRVSDVSGNIHRSNRTLDFYNSFSRTSSKESKTITEKKTANDVETSKNSVSEEEDFQINDASNTSKHANKACENIDNSISRTSTKERKRVKEKKDVNHRPQSIQKQKSPKRLKRVSDVSGNIHRSNRTLDFYNSFSRTSSKESKTITEKKTANDVETSKNSLLESENPRCNSASSSSKHIDDSFSRLSTKERKRVEEKKDANHQSQSIQKQKQPKILKKFSDVPGNVRRSSRTRLQPLDHWRNERVVYQCDENGMLQILRKEEGTKFDDGALRSIGKRLNKIKKNVKPRKPKKAKLIYPARNEVRSMDIVKYFSLIPWNESQNKLQTSENPINVKLMIATEQFDFGIIQIHANSEKPSVYLPVDLHMTVIKGQLKITVQENIYEVKDRDMFIIPKESDYSIKNIGKHKATLTYTVGPFMSENGSN